MVSKKHQSLSGEKAKISQRVGGKFTAWGSHLSGINLVLKPGKKIVQAWRCDRLVARSLLDRNFRHHEGQRWFETQIHPNRHSPASIQRSLPRVDRDLLDTNEGNIRDGDDQREHS
jgi:hypothetical protein